MEIDHSNSSHLAPDNYLKMIALIWTHLYSLIFPVTVNTADYSTLLHVARLIGNAWKWLCSFWQEVDVWGKKYLLKKQTVCVFKLVNGIEAFQRDFSGLTRHRKWNMPFWFMIIPWQKILGHSLPCPDLSQYYKSTFSVLLVIICNVMLYTNIQIYNNNIYTIIYIHIYKYITIIITTINATTCGRDWCTDHRTINSLKFNATEQLEMETP